MVRTLLSVVALVGLAAVPPDAHASQSKGPAAAVRHSRNVAARGPCRIRVGMAYPARKNSPN